MLKLAGKNVMVVGGAGFIGSHVVDKIVPEAPNNLVVVDNLFLGKEQNLAEARQQYPALKFYQQDASDYAIMKQICNDEQIEVVFNLAVIPLPTSLENPRWTVEMNVALTTVICELIREGHYQTLIHFSSSEAYGTAQYVPMGEDHPLLPSTPYAASKIAGDHIVLSYGETFGIDMSIIRPFNNFGPRQNKESYAGIVPIVIERALRGDPIMIYGDGEQTRDYIYVVDTADAAIKIYNEPATRGLVINVATGQEITINRLVRQILENMNSTVPIVYDDPRPGDVRRHCGAIDLAQQLIGFEPIMSMNDGLAATVAWYVGAYETQPALR
ncbi:MAG: GDP-mannose 4,6-dehydratase [Anaerolineae bacterium]|nr:GDP-mannose 4,6-dehydratase [Anaerolineae bacterium]